MIGDYGERNVDKAASTTKHFDPEKWSQMRALRETFGQEILQKSGVKLETHNILILVDLQGIYMNLHEWLRDRDFPIEGGLVLSRLAFFQIHSVFERIKKRALSTTDASYLDFEQLLNKLADTNTNGKVSVSQDATYLKFLPQFELYYAPSPLQQVEWQLRSQNKKGGSFEVRDQLNMVQSGIVRHRNFKRDYLAYDDFISKLKANPEYSKSEEGFYTDIPQVACHLT